MQVPTASTVTEFTLTVQIVGVEEPTTTVAPGAVDAAVTLKLAVP